MREGARSRRIGSVLTPTDFAGPLAVIVRLSGAKAAERERERRTGDVLGVSG